METAEEKKCCETKKCGCCCHRMDGVFIVLIGVLLLLVNLDVLSDRQGFVSFSIIVILFGLSKIGRSFCKCCDKS
jgi:hypothetical protein